MIHQDGLSFYIHTTDQILSAINKQFKHSSNPIEILKSVEDCFAKESELNQDFDQVKLIYHHDIFTLVPKELFKESHAADYLKYNTRLLQTDTLSVDEELSDTGANLVYVAYSNINNYFYEKYGSYSYFHYSALVLQQLGKLGDGLFIEVMPSHFYLTIYKEGKLIAHNLFQHEQIEDILFYTLYAAEQNQLDPELFRLTIIQEVQDQELFDLLYTYVREVSFIPNYSDYLNHLVCA
ncbi:hypothetical protein NMS_2656 [Nonlabens marinus S1-08]|uniref:DUF3822 family protein n=1 Tax=Nonlabens marinus S1-08 TaxID=1454201 RepID=W8VT04_9FLAO|nr:hypothetical protein NMS_2656 [Nonlabens marinus S1-08]